MKTPERQVSLISQSPQFQASGSTPAFFNELSGSLEVIANEMQAKADSIYINEFLTSASKSAKDIYERNINNPSQLEQELQANKEGLINNIPNNLANKLAFEYDSLATQYIGKATEAKNTELAAKERLASNDRYNSLLSDAGFAAQNMFAIDAGMSEDEVKVRRLNAFTSMITQLDSIEKHILQPDSKGNIRSQAEINTKITQAREYVFSQAAMSYYNSSPDKLKALNDWVNGEVVIESPQGNLNLRESMDIFVAQDVQDKLLASYKEEQKVLKDARKQQEEIEGQYKNLQLATKAINNEIALDPTNKDDKKAIDASWGQLEQQMIDNGGSIEEILAAASDLTVKTGMVPSRIEGILSSNILNGGVEQKAAYSDYIANINRKSPRALQNIDDNVAALAITISQNLDAGLSAKEAVAWAEADIDLAKKEERSFRKSKWNNKKQIDESIKQLTKNLQDEEGFDFFARDPLIPDGLITEYKRLEENFYVTEGVDRKAARSFAEKQIRETWGVTKIGRKRMMKYAPEVIYRNAAGTQWIEEQLLEKTGRKKGEVALEINPDTARDDKPSYFVTELNEFDVYEIMLDENNQPISYTPDFASSKLGKKLKQRFKNEQVTRDEAREGLLEQKEINSIFSNIYF